jgi:glycosyltransferase involved in cell wall biosynthesis
MKYCVIIPTYNNDSSLEGVISDVSKVTKDIIVVNDGSSDSTSLILKKFGWLKTISYSPNKGKGYAIRKGFELATAAGYNYAITMDSDGQHYAGDINIFIRKIMEEPDALIIGARNLAGEDVSKGSSFANRFSNFWYKFLTGIELQDTQTGFRLYPLDRIKRMRFFTNKYEFELEILVRTAWKGIHIMSVPIRVYYPPKKERISHFRPFRDFARISLLNVIFVIIALFYAKPFSFLKYLNKENIREFVSKHILLAHDTNLNIALAIALGIFMGIVPIWGFQLITAIALAHLFRLSKFIVIVAANISIPPMIPFILYASYVTGGIVLGTGALISFSGDLTIRSFENNLLQYIIGSIVFAFILAIFAGLISFIILKCFRKKPVVSQ